MQEAQLEEIPEGKVYTPLSIRIATFFGGVPVGAYMLAENFKVLGEKRKAATTWLIAIFVFVLLIATPFIPVLDQIPPVAYPLIYAIAAGWAARRYQSDMIDEHIEKGGDVYSAGRVIIITLIGIFIIAAFLLAIFFIRENMMAG